MNSMRESSLNGRRKHTCPCPRRPIEPLGCWLSSRAISTNSGSSGEQHCERLEHACQGHGGTPTEVVEAVEAVEAVAAVVVDPRVVDLHQERDPGQAEGVVAGEVN